MKFLIVVFSSKYIYNKKQIRGKPSPITKQIEQKNKTRVHKPAHTAVIKFTDRIKNTLQKTIPGSLRLLCCDNYFIHRYDNAF